MAERILVAEDDESIRVMVERLLIRHGYTVVAVQNGGEAIEKIAHEQYDAVLLDFMMPVAGGFDVIDWMFENRPDAAKACVIVVTAAISELKTFDASRVFAVIKKPFDIDDLLATVDRCVQAKLPIKA